MRNPKPQHPVWDLPIRLFHWLLVASFAACWLSAELDELTLHQYSGLTVLNLIVFRLLWGWVGSDTARFASFIHGPRAAFEYIKGAQKFIGHNPLGGWSVLALLTLLLTQATSGLMNTDDIYFEGPLYAYVSGDLAELAASIHGTAFNVLLGFIFLHIAAIVVYRWRGKPLVKAMITGHGEDSAPTPPAPNTRALIVAITSVAMVWGPYLLIT